MSYKIAAASSDGERVDRHFGHADLFYIAEVADDETYQLTGKRTLKSPCRHGIHDLQEMQKAVEVIADCRYVLCEAIGAGAATVLEQCRITPLETDELITKAIENIILYRKRFKKMQCAAPTN